MRVLFRRPDNTFVIELDNGYPYHVIPEDPLYNELYDDAMLTDLEVVQTPAVPPPSATSMPSVISDRQFFQQLALDNFISQQEALDAVQTGAIPSVMEGFVNGIEDPVVQFNARMILSGATEFQRNHPMVNAIGAYIGLDDAWIDGFFQRAALL